MFYNFEVGNKTYELKLTTKSVMQLEKKIGMNPMMIFGMDGGNIPTVSVMVAILHASLQAMNHGFSEDDAAQLFDDWISEGHIYTDFVEVIYEIYVASGIIKKENEKN